MDGFESRVDWLPGMDSNHAKRRGKSLSVSCGSTVAEATTHN